jgi:formate hydrogenlyase subunit 6/NADH:ubiquinone oxidoreductase subunit I
MKKVGKMLPFVMKMLNSKPATVCYPFEKVEPPEDFRGKLKYDAEKCIGCKICMRDCPSGAIEIEKVAEKKFKAVVYLDRCIFCGQCTDSCPKNALACTKNFELANFSREKLREEL